MGRRFYEAGFTWGIFLVITIFLESIIQNHTNILKREQVIITEPRREVKEREISGKIYCSSYREEIMDKVGGFCSKCGAPIK